METGLPGLNGLHVQRPVVEGYKNDSVIVQIQHQQTVENPVKGLSWKPKNAV